MSASLSYEKGVSLAFDTSVLRTAAQKYLSISGDLDHLSQELQSLLKELTNSAWTTEAGKAFQKMVEMDWSKALTRYCELLNTLAEILKEAANRYETLVDHHVLPLTMA